MQFFHADYHNAESFYAECKYVEFRYGECHFTKFHHTKFYYAGCRYTECHYPKCLGAKENVAARQFQFQSIQFRFNETENQHPLLQNFWRRGKLDRLSLLV